MSSSPSLFLDPEKHISVCASSPQVEDASGEGDTAPQADGAPCVVQAGTAAPAQSHTAGRLDCGGVSKQVHQHGRLHSR